MKSFQTQGTVLAVFAGDDDEQNVQIVLDRTPFYAEGGGQAADTGYITSSGAKAQVLSVEKSDGIIIHNCRMEEGAFCVGDSVRTAVDVAPKGTAQPETIPQLIFSRKL